jgi:hypothetical protein
VVQEFIAGRAPPRLDDCVAEQMTGILGLQEAMFPGAAGGWGQWAAGVVFEDWDGLRPGQLACSAVLAHAWWARWHARRGPLKGPLHNKLALLLALAECKYIRKSSITSRDGRI